MKFISRCIAVLALLIAFTNMAYATGGDLEDKDFGFSVSTNGLAGWSDATQEVKQLLNLESNQSEAIMGWKNDQIIIYISKRSMNSHYSYDEIFNEQTIESYLSFFTVDKKDISGRQVSLEKEIPAIAREENNEYFTAAFMEMAGNGDGATLIVKKNIPTAFMKVNLIYPAAIKYNGKKDYDFCQVIFSARAPLDKKQEAYDNLMALVKTFRLNKGASLLPPTELVKNYRQLHMSQSASASTDEDNQSAASSSQKSEAAKDTASDATQNDASREKVAKPADDKKTKTFNYAGSGFRANYVDSWNESEGFLELGKTSVRFVSEAKSFGASGAIDYYEVLRKEKILNINVQKEKGEERKFKFKVEDPEAVDRILKELYK